VRPSRPPGWGRREDRGWGSAAEGLDRGQPGVALFGRARVAPFGRTEVALLGRTQLAEASRRGWLPLAELQVALIPRAVTDNWGPTCVPAASGWTLLTAPSVPAGTGPPGRLRRLKGGRTIHNVVLASTRNAAVRYTESGTSVHGAVSGAKRLGAGSGSTGWPLEGEGQSSRRTWTRTRFGDNHSPAVRDLHVCCQ
jgi:hypothetical protein